MPETTNHKIKSDIKKAYNEIASVYLTWTKPSHETRLSYLDLLLQSIHSAKETHQLNILELGCGAGVPCTQLLSSHAHISITANDISSTQIALAKERLPPSVNLILGDMMELEFSAEQFDAVMAMYSIFHLPRMEQTTMLRRIFGWLKPGGRLLANFSEAAFESSTNGSWLGATEGAMHWSGWGREEVRRVLKEIGFGIEVDEVTVDREEDNGGGKSVGFHWVLARKE